MFVIKEPIYLSPGHIKAIYRAMGYNARELQPLNGRTIQYDETIDHKPLLI